MKNNIPILFVEINDLNYIFVAGIYDENKKFKVVEKIITPNEEISKERLINIENASNIIKKNVELIENKLNYVFKDLTIIIENFDFTCVNISGSKKLNGSKVLKENISYILNSLKLTVMENEERKTKGSQKKFLDKTSESKEEILETDKLIHKKIQKSSLSQKKYVCPNIAFKIFAFVMPLSKIPGFSHASFESKSPIASE